MVNVFDRPQRAVDWDALAQVRNGSKKPAKQNASNRRGLADQRAMPSIARTDLVKLQELIAITTAAASTLKSSSTGSYNSLKNSTKNTAHSPKTSPKEELAIYDLITSGPRTHGRQETKLVKAIALLGCSQSSRPNAWSSTGESNGSHVLAVRSRWRPNSITYLRAFDVDTFQTKCDLVYQHLRRQLLGRRQKCHHVPLRDDWLGGPARPYLAPAVPRDVSNPIGCRQQLIKAPAEVGPAVYRRPEKEVKP